MRSIILASAIIAITGCSTASKDQRIDSNYDELKKNRRAMYSLNETVEASAKEEPSWVTTMLDSWDCGENFCAIGRAEITADNSSAYRCLEVSKISAKANLVSIIQTDISQKIINGSEDFGLSQQKLKSITTAGFEIRNISNMRVSENYYRKVMKHVNESPQANYQCFSVATISKFHLQNLITREANKLLPKGTSESFDQELQKEWQRFFKIDGSTTQIRFEDLQTRDSLRTELSSGDLDSIRDNVARIAKAFRGVKYQFGSNLVEDGMTDCSAFTKKVYDVVGLNLPRTSPEQFNYSKAESVSGPLKKGDLVFFDGFRGKNVVSHVGIMLNDSEFVNANGNVGEVKVDNINDSYWQDKYMGARRLITESNFPNSNRSLAGGF
jgi:cell wall-associated NlpC family hydrolase